MTWKTLQHQNVLPLLGVKMSKKQLALASEWMANGNINTFVETHGDANRFELVGFFPSTTYLILHLSLPYPFSSKVSRGG